MGLDADVTKGPEWVHCAWAELGGLRGRYVLRSCLACVRCRQGRWNPGTKTASQGGILRLVMYGISTARRPIYCPGDGIGGVCSSSLSRWHCLRSQCRDLEPATLALAPLFEPLAVYAQGTDGQGLPLPTLPGRPRRPERVVALASVICSHRRTSYAARHRHSPICVCHQLLPPWRLGACCFLPDVLRAYQVYVPSCLRRGICSTSHPLPSSHKSALS